MKFWFMHIKVKNRSFYKIKDIFFKKRKKKQDIVILGRSYRLNVDVTSRSEQCSQWPTGGRSFTWRKKSVHMEVYGKMAVLFT